MKNKLILIIAVMGLSSCDLIFGEVVGPFGNGSGAGTALTSNKGLYNTWTMQYAIQTYTDNDGNPLPDKTDSSALFDLSIRFSEPLNKYLSTTYKPGQTILNGDYEISVRNETKLFGRIKPLLYPFTGKFQLNTGAPQVLQLEQQWQYNNNGQQLTLITDEWIKERDTLYWKTTKLVFK